MYSAEGLMTAVLMAAGRPNLAMDLLLGTSTATDAETVAAFHSAYGFAGTYVVEGSVITHQLLVSTVQNWVGTSQVRPFELEDDMLSLYPPNWRLRARRWPGADDQGAVMTIDDYVAIVAVLNRYADVCDTKDFDRFVDVFTADATMDYSTIPDVHVGHGRSPPTCNGTSEVAAPRSISSGTTRSRSTATLRARAARCVRSTWGSVRTTARRSRRSRRTRTVSCAPTPAGGSRRARWTSLSCSATSTCSSRHLIPVDRGLIS